MRGGGPPRRLPLNGWRASTMRSLRQAIETAFARQPFALNAARKEWREKGRNGVIRGMFAESIAAAIRTPPIEEERHSGQGEN